MTNYEKIHMKGSLYTNMYLNDDSITLTMNIHDD